MPLVCINRPNRTKKRYFTACAAARIAREVVKDDPETTPEEVLACIAKGFGFTHISLSRIRVVEQSIIKPKHAIIILRKSIPLLEKLTTRFPWLKSWLGPLIVALKKVIEFVNKIDTIDPPQGEVDDVINKEKCNCSKKKGNIDSP